MKKTLLLLTVILMEILGGAEVDLFTPSFPELQHVFDLTPFWVEALLSVNFIGFCLSLFFVGALADRYGRKPIILLGLVVFVLGSVLCLYASTDLYLLTGRFLQGLGIAAPTTQGYLIIADLYPIKAQQFYMAVLNGLTNASVGAAPVLGSYITLHFHWHGNFSALLLLGFTVLIMTLLFIPMNRPTGQVQSLSFSEYLPIFRAMPLVHMMLMVTFCASSYWVFIGMAPLLYIEALGVSLEHFGYYQGSLAALFAVASIISGFMLKYVNQQKMLYFSTIATALSVLPIAWLAYIDSADPLWITIAQLPYCLACAIPITILYPLALNYLPEAKGRISAVIHGGRLISTAIGLQIAGYIYTGSYQSIGYIIALYSLVPVISLCYLLKTASHKLP